MYLRTFNSYRPSRQLQESDFSVVLPGRPIRGDSFDLVTDLVVGGEYRSAYPSIKFLEIMRKREALRVDRQEVSAGNIYILKSGNLQRRIAEDCYRSVPGC